MVLMRDAHGVGSGQMDVTISYVSNLNVAFVMCLLLLTTLRTLSVPLYNLLRRIMLCNHF